MDNRVASFAACWDDGSAAHYTTPAGAQLHASIRHAQAQQTRQVRSSYRHVNWLYMRNFTALTDDLPSNLLCIKPILLVPSVQSDPFYLLVAHFASALGILDNGHVSKRISSISMSSAMTS